ncbi:MAG: M28 family peptidase [Bacteroidetes bacterium]|nr:M28 family peptidase [Bacteroidota bacterium]
MGLPGQFRNNFKIIVSLIVTLFVVSCRNDEQTANNKPTTDTIIEIKKNPTPDFSADSTYAYIKAQVDFGPRVPGTPAHTKCAEYLVNKLKSYGFDVIVQKGTVQTFDKKKFSLKNIIASFNPEKQSRILVCSHWDTRPFADEDTKDTDKPFDGANDGASGVGVALEIARQISLSKPLVGFDILFFDLEDYGTSGVNESWCLGSQYWSKNLHKPNYYANFGVLLDMVAGPNAIFPKESYSAQLAGTTVEKIWKTAKNIGYDTYFISQVRSFVGVDDHIYVNQAGIPCIDIIEYNQATGGFGDYHHTHKDDMSIIDKNTLKAVGQTLLEVIYSEK